MLIGLGNLIEDPQRIDLRCKISLNLRSEVQIKSLPNSQELVMIGCVTLNLRRENDLIHKKRIQLMESAMVSALKGWIISLVVAREVTK